LTPPNVDGPRACTKDDLPGMIAVVDAEMRKGSSQSLLTDYPLVYGESNLENAPIVKVGGQVVSVVPFIPKRIVLGQCRFSIGIISPTATAPVHRKKGYALACLRWSVDKMTQDDIDLSVLWTEVPTFRFYENAHYQAVRCPAWIYPCRREDAERFGKCDVEVIRYDPDTQEHIGDIRAMHEREVYGVIRAVQEYPLLFNLPHIDTLLAARAGRSVAYLVVSRAINKPGLLEAGGDAGAVEALVRHALLELEGDAVLNAHANLTPSVLGSVLHERMPERRQPNLGGHQMMRINNVRAFMGRISTWLVGRNAGAARAFSITVTDTGETISFAFREDTLELGAHAVDPRLEMSLQDLTSVVFGAHPERPVSVPPVLKDLFPFYFPIYILDRS